MSLKSDLRTMPLPDVLQWVAAGRKTGTLHLEHGSIRKQIVLRDGAVHTSWSNDPRESLGQFLVRLRLITEEQLFNALLAQETEGRLLGAILLDRGWIAEADLRHALQMKAEETLYDLFLWPSGQFEFRDGELPDRVPISIDAPVTPVILEGIRRVDEWARIRAAFPTMETTLRPARPLAPDASEDERCLVALAALGRSLAAIALEMRTTEFEAASRAFDLYRRGHLEVHAAPAATTATDPVGAIQALLQLAADRLAESRFEAARKAYLNVQELDRLNLHARKGLLAVESARERQRQLAAIPRDATPALAVDFATLTSQNLDPQEGFVLSRVNGQWDVQSILKLCPMVEEDTLLIFSRLLARGLIRLG